jgi:hypothetical protein
MKWHPLKSTIETISGIAFFEFNLFKGRGSISFFLKNGLKIFCRKYYENNLRSNNYVVCTAVAHCIPNILDVMVLENV